MDDESKKNLETNIFRKFVCQIFNVRNVFQSFRVRRSAILSRISNRQFILCQYRFVLNIGIIFWIIFLVSQVF
jgi:hypothetical protein